MAEDASSEEGGDHRPRLDSDVDGPAAGPRPAAVAFATTEHFTLQSARASTIAESTGRATMSLGAVAGGLVALGLIATASRVGTAFYAVGLVLLPTLAFTGLVTFERVLQSGIEDLGYARRIALLRGHYFDEAPELIPYLLSVPEQRQADLPHPPLHAAVKQPVWATLQRELRWIHRSRTWATRDQLRCALFGYVECFYNPVRIQERLGYRSPADYEQVSVA